MFLDKKLYIPEGWQAASLADKEEDHTFKEENEEIGGGVEVARGRERDFSLKNCAV